MSDPTNSHRIFYVRQEKKWWNHLFEASPFLTLIIAILGIVYAVHNVDRTLDLNREVKAIELFRDYSLRVEANVNFTDTAFTHNPKNWDDNYILFAQYALFIAESIYNIHKDNIAWQNTLKDNILSPHLVFYEKNKSVDSSLTEDFRAFYYKFLKESQLNISQEK